MIKIHPLNDKKIEQKCSVAYSVSVIRNNSNFNAKTKKKIVHKSLYKKYVCYVLMDERTCFITHHVSIWDIQIHLQFIKRYFNL